MKCPKCGYLGFESGERCRNCGYEFALSHEFDLDRILGAPDSESEPSDLPLFSPPEDEGWSAPVPARRSEAVRASARLDDDAPLIATTTRPRAPLGVRRPTQEVTRARTHTTKPITDRADLLFDTPPAAVIGRKIERPERADGADEKPAEPARRVLAGMIDAALLLALDAIVVYFTVQVMGLTTAQTFELPLLPLAAFFLILNGGYFVAFTAVGGQSIGKMAADIKVVGQDDESVPIGRATVRTLGYLVSALPLGAGFVAGLTSGRRLTLHDRLAHTRVVRPT